MSTRIGILGGTFNPVHLGHLIMAQDAMECFELSRILFIPCNKPPHKDGASLVASSHRMAMLEAALEGAPHFEACDIEIRRGGATYTIDTLRALKQRYPHDELAFIIGSDTLTELYAWKQIGELLELCRFVTLARPGFDLPSIRDKDLKLPPPWPRRLLESVASGHAVNIASSDIRHRVEEGMNIQFLVPHRVDIYIAEHHLYGMS